MRAFFTRVPRLHTTYMHVGTLLTCTFVDGETTSPKNRSTCATTNKDFKNRNHRRALPQKTPHPLESCSRNAASRLKNHTSHILFISSKTLTSEYVGQSPKPTTSNAPPSADVAGFQVRTLRPKTLPLRRAQSKLRSIPAPPATPTRRFRATRDRTIK